MRIIDIIQRKINSFLFRFVILGYALTIVLTHENTFFSYAYTIGFIAYFIIYLFLLPYQKFRLVNDFIFISFVICGKNPNEAFIFIFILLPVINSINFSGRKKSPLLYLISAITYMGLLCFYNDKIEPKLVYNSLLLPLGSLIFLSIIESYTSLRIKIRDFRERLNEVVDGFYTNKEFIKKPHKIYSELISLINTRIKKDLITDLFCFTILSRSESKIVIVNSSKFIWQYSLGDNDFIKKFEERDYQIDVEITIDNQRYPYNLALHIPIEDVVYIFVFITKKTVPLYYILIGFFRTLVPSLSKMAKILLSEKRLQEIKNEELQKLSIRSQYVTRATKAMHYIRNRLGPVNNLIKMLDTKDSVTDEKLKGFNSLLETEKDRAKIELQSIVTRANYLLEKSNNPFNFTKTEKVSLEKLYSIFFRNVNIFFPNSEIKIAKPIHLEKMFVEINTEGFELLLTDWLNNIHKYYKSIVDFAFTISADNVLIIFHNDYTVEESIVNQLISDLMSDDRNEIMKRTTHGLFQIKTSLEEMKIKYSIEKVLREHNFLKFTFDLKTLNNENSSI